MNNILLFVGILLMKFAFWSLRNKFEDFKEHQKTCIEKTSGFSFDDAHARYEKLKNCLEEKSK